MKDNKSKLSALINSLDVPSAIKTAIQDNTFKLEVGQQSRQELLRIFTVRLKNKREMNQVTAGLEQLLKNFESSNIETVVINAIKANTGSFVVYTDQAYTKVFGIV